MLRRTAPTSVRSGEGKLRFAAGASHRGRRPPPLGPSPERSDEGRRPEDPAPARSDEGELRRGRGPPLRGPCLASPSRHPSPRRRLHARRSRSDLAAHRRIWPWSPSCRSHLAGFGRSPPSELS
ncbi:uncharacterized protein LOC120699693 [Panicum virgatum]|uniref:uncharacterized protein LOC120699693 n=1 Tax=Panicum virgatum TaxID=38727 RepID=UPI0019D54657|nr:uncharacterized protein LOC120699693 [Panicum virgatum]